jgi:hypothetical protein
LYIHLGGDVLIKKTEIVAMIDLSTVKKNKINENFLKSINDNNKYNSISENGKAKTLIITVGESYLSPISSTTLFKRGDLGDTALGTYDAKQTSRESSC